MAPLVAGETLLNAFLNQNLVDEVIFNLIGV